MKAAEFDEKFDAGESVVEFLDLSRGHRPGLASKRINVDCPAWMVEAIDREARKLGVPRQSLIKVWLAECLESLPG